MVYNNNSKQERENKKEYNIFLEQTKRPTQLLAAELWNQKHSKIPQTFRRKWFSSKQVLAFKTVRLNLLEKC